MSILANHTLQLQTGAHTSTLMFYASDLLAAEKTLKKISAGASAATQGVKFHKDNILYTLI